MGRKPNTELRRQQIVAALLQEMAEAGYERASTKSIAARAGLAPGLLHYHFSSKEEILLELLEGLLADARARRESSSRPTSVRASALVRMRTSRWSGPGSW